MCVLLFDEEPLDRESERKKGHRSSAPAKRKFANPHMRSRRGREPRSGRLVSLPYSYATLIQKKMAGYFRRRRCPICGRPGSGPYGKKIKGREYLYFAHSFKNPETGRHCLKWCYVGPALAIEGAGGISAYLEAVRSHAAAVS